MTASELDELLRALERREVGRADVAAVLGSGFGAVAERAQKTRTYAFEELAGLPRARVSGHAGRLVLGEIAGRRVVLCQGRVHRYEGWSTAEVTRLVRALAQLGTRCFLLTNAAGSLRLEVPPGSLMRVRDQIDLQPGRTFPGCELRAGSLYDAKLGASLERAAQACGVTVSSGVYAGVLGPSYETPAEIRMLRWMGADAVGMSTVAEATALVASGARVAALSLISNFAAGLTETPLDHGEVLAAGAQAAERVGDVIEAFIAELP